MLAPIIIFAFNRLDALKNTVASLLKNEEAKDSELFVFVDGPRINKDCEAEKIKAVQDYVKTICGFKRIEYSFSNENKGLGHSIIAGVTEIINRYGKAIVLEDDLIVSSNFLFFMNLGLGVYEKEQRVFSICGYTNKVKVPKDYHQDVYFCTRCSSWGWGTWKDRWNTVDWQLNDWNAVRANRWKFNKWGGSDCYKMLRGWHDGKNQSWAIRFCYSQFLQDKHSLFPIISKVNNNGFDGQGTNCKKYSRFRCDFDETGKKDFIFPIQTEINTALWRSAMSYHTIAKRLWSKIMYMIYK